MPWHTHALKARSSHSHARTAYCYISANPASPPDYPITMAVLGCLGFAGIDGETGQGSLNRSRAKAAAVRRSGIIEQRSPAHILRLFLFFDAPSPTSNPGLVPVSSLLPTLHYFLSPCQLRHAAQSDRPFPSSRARPDLFRFGDSTLARFENIRPKDIRVVGENVIPGT
jgi:hypothetical protein